jgi:tetratricopeptide (TPR) repeat protein
MLTHRITLVLALVLSVMIAAPAVRADGFQEAQLLYKQGKRGESLARVESHLQQNPRDGRARFLKGVILTEQNRPQEAIAVFTALTQDFPELPEPYNNLAVLHASLGDYSKAREALEMAIRTHPSYATAHENLGDIYAAMARDAYDKALQLDKANKSARTKLELIRAIVPGAEAASTAAADSSTPTATAPPERAPSTSAADVSQAAAAVPADPAVAVLAGVEAWAQAWSRGDAATYLSAYAPGFRPQGGETRAAWEATRRARLEQTRNVSVTIASPKVVIDDPSHASVTFRQHYASATFKRTAMKTLHLVNVDGRWLIEREILADK